MKFLVSLDGFVEPRTIVRYIKRSYLGRICGDVKENVRVEEIKNLHEYFGKETLDRKLIKVHDKGHPELGYRWYAYVGEIIVYRKDRDDIVEETIGYRYANVSYVDGRDKIRLGTRTTNLEVDASSMLHLETMMSGLVAHFGGWKGSDVTAMLRHEKTGRDRIIAELNGYIPQVEIERAVAEALGWPNGGHNGGTKDMGFIPFAWVRAVGDVDGMTLVVTDGKKTDEVYFHHRKDNGMYKKFSVSSYISFYAPNEKEEHTEIIPLDYSYTNVREVPKNLDEEEKERLYTDTTRIELMEGEKEKTLMDALVKKYGGWVCISDDIGDWVKVGDIPKIEPINGVE